ncbi:MAG TPA: PAS domain S-box protein [Candidatus Cloacimonadota bacterium]|nr:PAS domain S-box protein [Candidatus Cloacimonadota bacterium]
MENNLNEKQIKTQAELLEELKLANQKLRESEQTYRNLFQNAQVGLFRTRISDGQTLECNDQLAQIFGYESRETFINHYATSENYVDPGTRERMLKLIEKDGTIQNFDARFYDINHRVLWIRYSAKIYPEKGWIEGVVENITEKKKAEYALQESEEKFRTLADNIPSVIYMYDNKPDSITLYLNDAIQAYTGYPKEEFIHNQINYKDLIHHEDKEAITEQISSAIDAGQSYHLIYRLKHKSGKWRWIEDFGKSIRLNEGYNVIEGFLLDITERMEAEQKLQEYRNHLEELVKERTSELEEKNKRLIEFNKLFVGREFRIKELRNEIKILKEKLGMENE